MIALKTFSDLIGVAVNTKFTDREKLIKSASLLNPKYSTRLHLLDSDVLESFSDISYLGAYEIIRHSFKSNGIEFKLRYSTQNASEDDQDVLIDKKVNTFKFSFKQMTAIKEMMIKNISKYPITIIEQCYEPVGTHDAEEVRNAILNADAAVVMPFLAKLKEMNANS